MLSQPRITSSLHHNDHLGTPLALSGENGELVAEWVRDPFGNVVSKTGDVEDNHMFPGQFWDADAHLAYNWNRWYAPEIGRFTSPDLLNLRLMNSPQRSDFKNLLKIANPIYGYAKGNPFRYIDPTGLVDIQKDGLRPGTKVTCTCPQTNADPQKSSITYDFDNQMWSATCRDCNSKDLGFSFNCVLQDTFLCC